MNLHSSQNDGKSAQIEKSTLHLLKKNNQKETAWWIIFDSVIIKENNYTFLKVLSNNLYKRNIL